MVPTQLAECDPLADKRPRDYFVEPRFVHCSVTGDHVIISGNLVIAPTELAERLPIVENCP